MLYLLSHPMERQSARSLADALEARGVRVNWEGLLQPGASWEEWDSEAREGSGAVVALLPEGYEARGRFAYRVDKALEQAAMDGGPTLIAVLLGREAPQAFAGHQCLAWEEDVSRLAGRILEVTAR